MINTRAEQDLPAGRSCLCATVFLVLAALTLTQSAGAQAVGFSKAFAPPTIGPGSVSTLEFTISNMNPTALSNVAFTDDLPAGVTIARPNAAWSTCGDAVIDAEEDGSTIAFNAARVAASTTCTVSVNVTAAEPGTYMNTTGVLASDSGTYGTASADLVVAMDRPGFTKSFSPDTVSFGGRSTLTLTIDNTASTADLIYLDFTDDLPPGMTIASPSNASTTCQNDLIPATLDAEPGSGVIDLFFGGFGSFAAPPLCEVVVDVIGRAVGALGNTTGELVYNQTTGESSGKAGAVLTVTSSPFVFTKSFTDDPVRAGSTVNIEFNITNLSREEAASGLSFTDDLSATVTGLERTGGVQSDVCGAGSLLGGTSVLALTGGSLSPGASCTFSATLQVPTATAEGVYGSTTSLLTAAVGGSVVSGDPATDNLFVTTAGPVLTKTFTDDPVSPGSSASLQFTIENSNSTFALTDIAFVDELTTFLPFPVSATWPADGFCGAGSTMALDFLGTDRQGLSMTGGSLAAAGSCTFDVILDIPLEMPSGTYVNTTEPVTGVVDGEAVQGGTASDDLIVIAPPSVAKAFLDPVVAPGDTVTLEFAIVHGDEAAAPATDIAFADDLGAMFAGLQAIDTPLADICGPGSQLTGTSLLDFSGGSLGAGEECVFSVTLAVPSDAPFGSYLNRTDTLTAVVGGFPTSGGPAEAELMVTPLMLTKEFIDDPVLPGDTLALEFTIDNLGVAAAADILFTDNLRDALSGLQSLSGEQSDVCGTGSSLSGTTLLFFVGGSLGPGESCTFSTDVVVPPDASPGDYTNVTSALSATVGGPGVVAPGATDVLVVEDPQSLLVLSKEFTDDPVSPGSTVTLEFTVSYSGPGEAVDISFTDALETAISGTVAVGLPADDVCGTGSRLTGTSTLQFSGGVLASGASCSFAVTLTVPEVAGGSYTNTTSDVTARAGGVAIAASPASAELVIEAGEGRTGSIGGVVWFDVDGDGNQNEPEMGIEGVDVALSVGACPGGPSATTATLDDGTYVFTDLIPGDYCVDVDENTITSPVLPLLTTGNEPLTVALSSGERFDNANFGYDGSPVSTTPISDLPREYALRANYPNPFNPTTTISYDLPQASEVRLTVADLLGRAVMQLTAGLQPAGRYEISFDAAQLPSGVYFYRLEAGEYVESKRMVLVK